jgi:hypothetical protein
LQNPRPNCKILIRWKDRHANKKLIRESLKKLPQPSHGSQIQRLRTCASAVSRAVSPTHGSTVDRPHNPKGYAILSVRARSNGPDLVHAGVAANTPGRKTARRRLAGVVPRQCSRPPIHPRADALRSRNTRARDRGLRGNARAPMTAGAGRGRGGRSGELVSAPKCTRRREIERGLLLTVRRRGRRARRRRGCDGGGLATVAGRVALWRSSIWLREGSGSTSCGGTSSVSPWRTKRERKKGGGVCPSPAAAMTRRRRGIEAVARRASGAPGA